MGFMYPRFSVAVLSLSPVSAQGFNSAALSIGESLGAAVALAVTALVASAVAGGAFTAEFAVTVVVAAVAVVLAPRVRPRRRGIRSLVGVAARLGVGVCALAVQGCGCWCGGTGDGAWSLRPSRNSIIGTASSSSTGPRPNSHPASRARSVWPRVTARIGVGAFAAR